METRRVTTEHIQAIGSYDTSTGEYCLSLCSGGLVVSFDYLKEEDILEILSCLNCMLPEEVLQK